MGVAPPRSRPNVPELHIPHPESRPFENDTGRRSLSLDEYRTHEKPSPFRASTHPDPNSASGTGGPVFPPPHGTTSQPPQPSQREQKLEQSIALLSKRNRELEIQLAAQPNSGEIDRLQSRVHDLEVEVHNVFSYIWNNTTRIVIREKKKRN